MLYKTLNKAAVALFLFFLLRFFLPASLGDDDNDDGNWVSVSKLGR